MDCPIKSQRRVGRLHGFQYSNGINLSIEKLPFQINKVVECGVHVLLPGAGHVRIRSFVGLYGLASDAAMASTQCFKRYQICL